MVSWNCKVYPCRRGSGLGPIAEGKDFIFLMETKSGKGHGGITVLIKEMWTEIIKLEKEDPNKQHIWLKIINMDATIWLVAFYFAPKSSKFYKKKNLDSEDPYALLKKKIFQTLALREKYS